MIDIHDLEEGLLKRQDLISLQSKKKCLCGDICQDYWIVSIMLSIVFCVLVILITLDILDKL